MFRTLSVAIGLLVCLFTQQLAAGELLVIQSYSNSKNWDAQYTKALKRIHAKRHNMHFFEMKAHEFPEEDHDVRAEAAWKKYQELKPDYVVLGDDVAISLLGQRFARENIPVVFLGAKTNPRKIFKDEKFPQHFTGVLERPLVNRSVDGIRKLRPGAKKILLVFDSSEESIAALDQNGCHRRVIKGVTVDVRHYDDFQQWKTGIESARDEDYDAIIIGHHGQIKGADGSYLAADELLKWTNRASEVPLFAFWDNAVGKGKAIGGVLSNGYEQGIAAAKLLIQVAEGRTPSSVMCRRGQVALSRSELNRWKIDPPHSMLKKAVFVE